MKLVQTETEEEFPVEDWETIYETVSAIHDDRFDADITKPLGVDPWVRPSDPHPIVGHVEVFDNEGDKPRLIAEYEVIQ